MNNLNNDISDDDDDDNATDFFSFAPSDTGDLDALNVNVASVLKETLPKPRVVSHNVVEVQQEQNIIEPLEYDQDMNDDTSRREIQNDDDLLNLLPPSERGKAIMDVHIDELLGESSKQQLLRNITEEREIHAAQDSTAVPGGVAKRKHQITYLVAKAKADELTLKNMWSQNKLTKRQTQAKYGF